MRYLVLIISILCLAFHQSYPQEETVNTFHTFSGAVVFSAEAGGTYPFTDYSTPELDFFGRGLIEYYFPSKSVHAIGIRFLSGGGFLSGMGKDAVGEVNYKTSIFFIGGGLVYAIELGNGVPYLSATVSYLRFDPRDKDGNFLPNNFARKYDQNAIMYSGELGVRFPFAEVLSLNLGININFANTDYLDDIRKDSNTDAFATAFVGMSLYIGAEKDSDGDGVENNRDVCPNTLSGLVVDEFGCPLDTDTDGVPDYLDKCENTPKNILINNDGCPIDSDGDGVPDYLDKCPDTPLDQDIVLDENGCLIMQDVEADTFNTNQDMAIEEPDEILIENNYDDLNERHLANMIYTDGKLYCFQVASFQKIELAENLANSLILEGYEVLISEAIPFNDGNVWYRVKIGYFDSYESALSYKEEYFK